MHENAVRLKRLCYENIGWIGQCRRDFREDMDRINDADAEITFRVVRLLLGDLLACKGIAGRTSRIEAIIRIGRESYALRVVFRDEQPRLCATASDGSDCSDWYLRTVNPARKVQDLFCFEKVGQYPVRLYRCEDADFEVPQLRRFVRAFTPQRLLPGKDYWLHLEKDGRFTVRLGTSGQEIPCLSEAESLIYHYLCFLYRLDFQSEIQAYKQPVVIRSFADRLDEAVDLSGCYLEAKKRNRQVLVFDGFGAT